MTETALPPVGPGDPPAVAPAAIPAQGELTGGWQPLRVLGAASQLSLALPDAHPTPSQLYGPRGVLLDVRAAGGPGGGGATTRVIAADTGNHRLLIWPDLPATDGADAAVVIGQADPYSEGPQAGGRGPERGLFLPTGLALADGLLLVADGWNHRIVAYDAALDTDDPEPAWWLGQADLSSIEPNRGGEPDAASLYWPFGVTWHDGWLWVCDTGNRRVLGWNASPAGGFDPARPADVILGQPDAHSREENRGADVAADSFRWPHAIAVVPDPTADDPAATVLWVADAGNHRLLGWRLPLDSDRPADLVLGQPGFTSAAEMPHVPQGPSRLRFPYAATGLDGELLVGDTANNRVLGWQRPATQPVATPADAVLGQHSFDPAGENRWTAVTPDSFCWPYGLSAVHDGRPDGPGDVLAVADSGNNRVVLWNRR